MECRDVIENAMDRLSGQEASRGHDRDEIRSHLASCPSCRREVTALETSWRALGELPDPVVTTGLKNETLLAMKREVARRKVIPFRPRPVVVFLAQAAVVALSFSIGFLVARGREEPKGIGSKERPVDRVVLAPEQTIDVSRTSPDLTNLPKVANVSYGPVDPSGRMAVSFDVNTRYTLVGRPGEGPLEALFARLLSETSGTEGARAKAIELVSRNYSDEATPSPEVSEALVRTLRSDKNPGVRKKAAEALVKLPPTTASRDAFVAALASDTNPAVRILAIEGLAKAALVLRDSATIGTLREKATDEKEAGYVRAKAATALRQISM